MPKETFEEAVRALSEEEQQRLLNEEQHKNNFVSQSNPPTGNFTVALPRNRVSRTDLELTLQLLLATLGSMAWTHERVERVLRKTDLADEFIQSLLNTYRNQYPSF